MSSKYVNILINMFSPIKNPALMLISRIFYYNYIESFIIFHLYYEKRENEIIRLIYGSKTRLKVKVNAFTGTNHFQIIVNKMQLLQIFTLSGSSMTCHIRDDTCIVLYLNLMNAELFYMSFNIFCYERYVQGNPYMQ